MTETYRVDRETLKRDAPILLLLALDVAFGLWSWGRMPARVPVHWNMAGEADRWGAPWMNAILLPGIAAGLYLVLLVLPLIDPRRANYALFEGTGRLFRAVLVVFMVGLHVMVTLVSLGHAVPVDRVIRVAVPLRLVAFGNSFGRLRHNYFMGIRVPWTLASEEVWMRTHRLAGRLWVAGGLAAIPAAFLPTGPGNAVLVGILIVISAVPIVHSWWLYQKLEKEKGEASG